MNPADPSSPRRETGESSSSLDWPRRNSATDEVKQAIEAEVRRRRRVRRQIVGGCTFAAALALAAVAFRAPPASTASPPSPSAAGSLVVMQPGTRTLDDGTVVDLAEGAEISVAFSATERRVTLLHGTAYFQVASAPGRPFVVNARGVNAIAIGTAYAVRIEGQQVDVVVAQGRVAVDPRASGESTSSGRVMLDGGQRAVVALDSTGPAAVSDVASEVASILAWRVPRLVLKETPLGEVIAAFNAQPGARRMRLAQPELGALPLSGVLRADNVDVLLYLMRESYDLEAVKDSDSLVVRRRH